MGDVIFHLADGHMEKGLKAFFARDNWEFVLGCRRFEIDPLSETDFFRVGGDTDGGIWKHAGNNLRPFRDKYEHAVVILDADFVPHPGADVLHQDISAAMVQSGWSPERFVVVVIQPELEAWLWAPNLNVAQAFGHGDFGRLRAALEREHLWNPGEAKPHDLKAARDRAAKLGGKRTGGPIFKGVFSAISRAACVRCEERGFIALRTALQGWFPREREAWEQ
jgi:hypothetical protein